MTTAGWNKEATEQVAMRLSIEDDVSTVKLRSLGNRFLFSARKSLMFF
jgi:hypothetical protein